MITLLGKEPESKGQGERVALNVFLADRYKHGILRVDNHSMADKRSENLPRRKITLLRT